MDFQADELAQQWMRDADLDRHICQISKRISVEMIIIIK